MELAALDWAWNPTREPRETKLMIRLQQRENERLARMINAKQMFATPFVKPGQVVYVDGDPRDFDPTDLVHPTLLGKPRA